MFGCSIDFLVIQWFLWVGHKVSKEFLLGFVDLSNSASAIMVTSTNSYWGLSFGIYICFDDLVPVVCSVFA